MYSTSRVGLAVLFLLLVLLTGLTYYPTPVLGGSVFSVVSVNWYSSVGKPHVYPGSTNTLLVVEIMNSYNTTLYNVQGCIELPDGIYSVGGSCSNSLYTNGSSAWSIPPGTIFQLRYTLNIEKSVKPGNYTALINITYTVSPISRRSSWDTVNITLTVDKYPIPKVRIIDVYWQPEEVYPGTTGASLNIILKNYGDTAISNIFIKLELPEGFEPNKIYENIAGIGPGEYTTITFTGIDVEPLTRYGKYYFKLLMNLTARTDDGVEYEAVLNKDIVAYVSKPVPPFIDIVDKGFVGRVVYNESRFGDIYVTFVNRDIKHIVSVIAKLYLPEGVKTIDGKNYVVSYISGDIGFGETFTLQFNELNISSIQEKFDFTLELVFTMRYRGAEYRVLTYRYIEISLPSREIYLLPVETSISYNGVPASLLPSARDVDVSIRLLNKGPSSIRTITPYIEAPEGIVVKDIRIESYTGVSPGDVTQVSMRIDVDDSLKPGIYNITLKTLLVVQSGDSISYVWEKHTIPIAIANPDDYKPLLDIVNAYWGRGAPQTVYPGQRMIPLYIDIYNYGRYTAYDAIATIVSRNNTVVVVEDTSVLGDIGAGSLATGVYTLDLARTSNGTLYFTVSIRYVVKIYGAFIEYVEEHNITVPLHQFEGFKGVGLEVVDSSWSIDPVFPNTENISYTVTIANRYPFNVYGVKAKLVLPKGFSSDGKEYATAYVSGPLSTLQTTTLSFTVSVGNIEPGLYKAELILDYVVQVGGPWKSFREKTIVYLRINDPSDAIAFIDSYWLYQSSTPGSYGRYMVIILQNKLFPSMRGVVARIVLPRGVIAAHTNESIVEVYPTTMPQQIPVQTPLSREIERIISMATTASIQQTPETTIVEGDYMIFTIPVHLTEDASIGKHNVSMELSFIDHTGTLRKYLVNASISILGNILFVDIDVPTNTTIQSLEEEINVTIKLKGEGTIHNTYLVIYPYTPIVVPEKNMFYLGDLIAPKNYTISVKLYYNPLYTATAPVKIRYGIAPLVFTLVYTDELGYRNVFNISTTIKLAPLIKFDIRDLRVVQRNTTLKITGTLVNIGSSTAERVIVYAYVEGHVLKSFIGDIEPGSEVTFSMESDIGVEVDKGLLVISYYGPFDILYNKTIPINVVHEILPPPTEAKASTTQVIEQMQFYIIILVSLFLVASGLLIYRTLKKYSEKLSSTETI